MIRVWVVIFYIVSSVGVSQAEGVVTNKATSKAYVKKIRKLQAEGRKMELLRSSMVDLDYYACMEKMLELQPQADKLEKSGESLPMTSANMSFRSAAGSLKLCVSCNKSLAAQYCEIVEYFLQDGYKFLKEE